MESIMTAPRPLGAQGDSDPDMDEALRRVRKDPGGRLRLVAPELLDTPQPSPPPPAPVRLPLPRRVPGKTLRLNDPDMPTRIPARPAKPGNLYALLAG